MTSIKFGLLALLCGSCLAASAQTAGKLFIIGGGDRPPSLMQALISTAGMGKQDYAIVLPMSSGYPDTAYHYFRADFETVSQNPIVNFNFTGEKKNNLPWLDSLAKAKLIFITGGDQERFMNAVMNTPVYKAIHSAYRNGATIAGTSAGAAVMCEYMITGRELTDTVYQATFPRLVDKNIEFKPGLALLTSAIIDQHFVARSRYNRLLSALAKFPALTCIGIDEATAIIVEGNKVTVTGEGQVIVMANPENLKVTGSGLIKMEDLRLGIYTAGDEFKIKNK